MKKAHKNYGGTVGAAAEEPYTPRMAGKEEPMSRINSIAAAALIAWPLSGCASGPRLASGPALAKAKGTVSFIKTEDRGTEIVLNVEHLTEPEALNPPGYAYVAWVQSDREAPAYNVGALAVDDDRNGELKTVTPLRDFELFVTVETSSDASQPTGPPLLWTHRDERLEISRRDQWTQLASRRAR